MRKVLIKGSLSVAASQVWSIFTDINNLPTYVKFLMKTSSSGEMKVGTTWYDITCILWVPMRLKHRMTSVDKNKKLTFDVLIPFGGKMHQQFLFQEKKNRTILKGEIKFDLGNRFLEILVAPILQKRLQQMVEGTFQNMLHILQEETNGQRAI